MDNRDSYISESVLNGFQSLEYTLDSIEYPTIYSKILSLLPKDEISFASFKCETLIACEIICASICHKINWDFLRKCVYKKTMINPEWVEPLYLSKITAGEVYQLLFEYEKKERIMEKERCEILHNVGESILAVSHNYENIFFYSDTKEIRDFIEIKTFFESCVAFSNDPQQKKMQLLFQTLSDYDDFKSLSQYYKPTIDYHLIRLYLRRGVVKPINQFAMEYIFNNEAARKENTVATLRKVCSDSLSMLSWITSFDLKSVNRIEWWIGRTICINGMPDCYLKSEKSTWLKSKFDKCPFYEKCYARQYDEKFLEISEPLYKGESY